jgi:hypothetical protein
MVPRKTQQSARHNDYSPERGFAITALIALVIFGVWRLASHLTSLSNAKFVIFVAVMVAYWIVAVICATARE